MVEPQFSKLTTRVRFSSPAPAKTVALKGDSTVWDVPWKTVIYPSRPLFRSCLGPVVVLRRSWEDPVNDSHVTVRTANRVPNVQQHWMGAVLNRRSRPGPADVDSSVPYRRPVAHTRAGSVTGGAGSIRRGQRQPVERLPGRRRLSLGGFRAVALGPAGPNPHVLGRAVWVVPRQVARTIRRPSRAAGQAAAAQALPRSRQAGVSQDRRGSGLRIRARGPRSQRRADDARQGPCRGPVTSVGRRPRRGWPRASLRWFGSG